MHDITHHFVLLFTMFVMSVVIAGIWSAIDMRRLYYRVLPRLLHVGCRYYVGFYMVLYGMGKVIKLQFSDPGPPWVMMTPNFLRLLKRLNPSAAISAPRSCRNMMVRIPSLATTSISWLDGKQETHSTPSVFNIRATASNTFIQLPFVLAKLEITPRRRLRSVSY